jgi:hypothetical protein
MHLYTYCWQAALLAVMLHSFCLVSGARIQQYVRLERPPADQLCEKPPQRCWQARGWRRMHVSQQRMHLSLVAFEISERPLGESWYRAHTALVTIERSWS